MKTCTDCSSTIPSETEFGSWGTVVASVAKSVLQPSVEHVYASILKLVDAACLTFSTVATCGIDGFAIGIL